MKKNANSLRTLFIIFAVLGSVVMNFWWAASNSTTNASSDTTKGNDSPSAIFAGTGVGAIPDNNPTGLPVTFNVSGVTAPITYISVNMTMTHTWVGDLDVTLTAPNGTSHVIFSDVGATTATSLGDSSNLSGTYTFNDTATASFWAAAAAAAGSNDIIAPGAYRTSAAGGAGSTGAATNFVAAFSGLTSAQVNGTWTLRFVDDTGSDTGAVTAANLEILTGGATPTPTASMTPTATPTATATPGPGAIQDGGFEQNTGAVTVTNPFWTSTSTNFGTSLCTIAACGNGGGTAGPRTGNGWVWFDGSSSATGETGTVQQSVVFPNGGTVTLNYWLRIGAIGAPANSVLTVSVDGTVVQTINEPAAAETAYTLRTVDLSQFANGQSHTILFRYVRPAGTPSATNNWTIDDVSLVTGGGGTPTPTPTPTATPTPQRPSVNVLDFDGDRRADFAVFRPSNGTWYISRPTGTPNQSFTARQFGASGDIPTPADFDGDTRMDIAVFRPSNGTWYVINSSNNTFSGLQFGLQGDEPVARDYDGDGRADHAVVRRTGTTTNVPSGSMTWYVRNSSNGALSARQFGAGTDKTAPGDYDGDGKFDFAVYRGLGGNDATFYVFRSGTSAVTSFQFGVGSDLVVPGDYDGDGRTDYAVVRTSGTAGYQWFIQRSSQFSVQMDTFGTSPHVPVQNDYDGDGKTDIAVWNPQNGYFYVRRSSGAADLIVQFGAPGDIAIANYDTH